MARAIGLTLGLPRIGKEAGERRDFLPGFVRRVSSHTAAVVAERGIGSGMGLSDAEYAAIPRTRLAAHNEAYGQDVVLVLRAPDEAELRLLHPGATLVSMLHFSTRPERVRNLRRLGVDAISLDSLADDAGTRLVEDARAVAWNGLDLAFHVLELGWTRFSNPGRDPIRVTIIGAGAVGREAVEAATKYGDLARFERTEAAGLPGVEVVTIGRNLSRNSPYLRKRLQDTDILVDAAARHDIRTPVVPNTWIELLPRHAVICDLAVDGYDAAAAPPIVRGIEGIPAGSLDQQVFEPDDPRWETTVPAWVPSQHRRTVVSCYSWPGIRPRECMELYGEQLAPLLIELLDRGGLDGLRPARSALDRALLRAGQRAQPLRPRRSRIIRPARPARALAVTAREQHAGEAPPGRRPPRPAPVAART
jgi:alanine dehydrogenase